MVVLLLLFVVYVAPAGPCGPVSPLGPWGPCIYEFIYLIIVVGDVGVGVGVVAWVGVVFVVGWGVVLDTIAILDVLPLEADPDSHHL